jgi:hypothetical protein
MIGIGLIKTPLSYGGIALCILLACINYKGNISLHYRDSINEISLIDLCKRELGPADRHVLNIHDLEAYNKVYDVHQQV